MFDDCLPMGCLSSRSTTVSPIDSSASSSHQPAKNKLANNNKLAANQRNGYRSTTSSRQGVIELRPKNNHSDSGTRASTAVKQKKLADIGTSLDKTDKHSSMNQSLKGADDDIMPNSLAERDKSGRRGIGPTAEGADIDNGDDVNENRAIGTGHTFKMSDEEASLRGNKRSSGSDKGGQLEREEDDSPGIKANDRDENKDGSEGRAVALPNSITEIRMNDGSRENSLDEELNTDLLRQYIAVDFEISQLEDRDALRLYHEKIEQLEQLERELDMISYEAEEMAVRGEIDLSQLESVHSLRTQNRPDSKGLDLESNSIMSGVTGSVSPKSSIALKQSNRKGSNRIQLKGRTQQQIKLQGQEDKLTTGQQQRQQLQHNQDEKSQYVKESKLSYSTIEDVFNRKIILEKERDKLKKEVELVILECDKLQQRYKKRDEILDKLFDGRTGNGLENHLEQQLIWLMEQKHYVDQVFYTWKRAETLTSQTCEQFASALELLKRLPKVTDNEQRMELAKSICNLLIKSRQDMEQAQRYNPNVDAPFFTDAETERFDRIIDTIQSNSISQSDCNQMATVVQFAYKRAVSIRLWLEQILQITIARDSFELAEEYKWIAIQLRKERILLVNSKLQEASCRSMVQQVREQLAHQQHQQLQHHHQQQQKLLQHNQQTGQTQLAITDGKSGDNSGPSVRGQNEVNRDSGVESDDIDIEEDIYRLLEMNKSRLEAAVAASKEAGLPQATALDAIGRPMRPSQFHMPAKGPNQNQLPIEGQLSQAPHEAGRLSQQRDQAIRERIQRRVRGEQHLGTGVVPFAPLPLSAGQEMKLEPQERQRPDAGGADLPSHDIKSSAQRTGQMNLVKRDMDTSPDHIETNHHHQQRQQKQKQQRQHHEQTAATGHTPDDNQALPTSASSTPSKLHIQLDETSRQNLLSK